MRRDKILQALWELPLPDRASVLVLTIVERERSKGAIAVVDGVVKLLEEMLERFPTARLPVDDCFRWADTLRNIGDKLERRHETMKIGIH